MKNTEKRYWINGIDKRGKNFYTIAMSVKKYALLISFRMINVKINESFTAKKYFSIQLFKLI